MKIELVIKPDINKPYIVLYTNEVTDEIKDIINKVSNYKRGVLTACKNKKIYLINNDEIFCFYSENQKIYIKTDKENLSVKYKLYELEKMYKNTSFVRISKSCIVNVNKIKNLDFSFAGTIEIVFKNGDKEFVSRRYIPRIKKYLGM